MSQLGIFLSRLCGGERIFKPNSLYDRFLSRLCGGERVRYRNSRAMQFLSRLCGGEPVLRAQVIR